MSEQKNAKMFRTVFGGGYQKKDVNEYIESMQAQFQSVEQTLKNTINHQRAELDALRENAVVYEGVVTDRAMSECGAYIGLEFADGSGDCFYEVYGAPFPDGIAVGDRMRIAAWDGKAVSAEKTE